MTDLSNQSNNPENIELNEQDPQLSQKKLFTLSLTALGIVFGDIGTSPLYAIRESFLAENLKPTPFNINGVLSLIFWSLLLVICLKYVVLILKANNDGEGGILALTALVCPKRHFGYKKILLLTFMGLFGAALLYGDGIITPAISVISAIEGINIATPLFSHFVIPITLIILVFLFSFQKYGTAKIGAVFGPIMLIWFSVLALLGIYSIIQTPTVLFALNPLYALQFFIAEGTSAFLVMGAIFLVVTGGEALYADMGHFGARPIRLAWFYFVFPCLLLNYFGQGALLLRDPTALKNPFYLLAPEWALIPMLILATLATIIASQAVISGVFSLTRQAIQLGYAPRLEILHTSAHEQGQIYIPKMNWLLLAGVIWLVLTFKSSTAMAEAYGVAVSTTMVITTILAYFLALKKWHWPLKKCIFIFGGFLVIDLIFFTSNILKIADGGWFPLLVAGIVFTLMTTWSTGKRLLKNKIDKNLITIDEFFKRTEKQNLATVPGTAVYMTGNLHTVPAALLNNMKFNKVIHEQLIFVTVTTQDLPHVLMKNQLEVHRVTKNVSRINIKYGFMDSPNVPDALKRAKRFNLDIDISQTVFFIGSEIIFASREVKGMAVWREKLFAMMSSNAQKATQFFKIPPENVMEIGIHLKI